MIINILYLCQYNNSKIYIHGTYKVGFETPTQHSTISPHTLSSCHAQTHSLTQLTHGLAHRDTHRDKYLQNINIYINQSMGGIICHVINQGQTRVNKYLLNSDWRIPNYIYIHMMKNQTDH